MKFSQSIFAIAAACCLLSSSPSHATTPTPTAFTYQGRLTSGGTPVNTSMDFEFTLWTQASGGSAVGLPSGQAAVPVNQGRFTASLDFGPGIFNGQSRWLQIAVAPAGSGNYTVLTPRQAMNSTPMAQFASQVLPSGISGVISNPVTFTSGSNSFAGSGAGLTGLNSSSLVGALPNLLAGSYTNIVNFSNASNQYAGTFSGSGTALTNLNASNITTGTLADARLSSNVATLNGFQIFTGLKIFAALATQGPTGLGAASPSAWVEVRNGYPADTMNTAVFLAPATGPNVSHVHWGPNGDWFIRSASNTGVVVINDYGGNVGIGTGAPAYKLDVVGTFAANTVTIKGGSDLVEGFDSRLGRHEPGTVMVIDPDHSGQLIPSELAYDSKVAGVVSGAGGVNPGLKMGQDGVMDGENLIALTGRVYVKCTAANGNIRPGDRLTTSAMAGHAMKATDSAQADGAVIGKAMSSLESGEGLVLVLVNLQ